MRHSTKFLETDSCLLYSQNSVPFTDLKRKLSRPVNNHVGDVDGFVLCVICSGNADKIKEFFDGRKDGRDRFTKGGNLSS